MARQFQRTHSTNQEDFSLKSARSSIFACIAKNWRSLFLARCIWNELI